MAIMETVLEIPAEHERNIFGNFDSNIKKIEKNLNVTMVARDGNLKLVGEAASVKQAESILMELLELSKRGNTITEILAFIGGSAADLIRTYTIHIGDFGKYSRFGMTIFSLLMVFVHILKVIRGYSASIAENARHMQMEVQVIEEKNQELTIANEEAEKAKAEAIAAAKAKSVFLANMSHEIRTPINAILGMDTMILRESDDKDILEYAGNIQSASQTLLSLINDILDFSKIETGKLELVQGDYALSSLINDVYHMLLGKAKEKGLAFNVDSDKNLPAKLYGDEVRIRQILVNILNNAIKYTEKGSVTLKVGMSEQQNADAINNNKETKTNDCTENNNTSDIENVTMPYHDNISDTDNKTIHNNNNVTRLQPAKNIIITFTISDTGIGIKPENISHLFDSFSRFDENKNKHIEGTGLGLAITKQLTKLMNGKINVTSKYGEGSVFEVSIPQKIEKETYKPHIEKGNIPNCCHNCFMHWHFYT